MRQVQRLLYRSCIMLKLPVRNSWSCEMQTRWRQNCMTPLFWQVQFLCNSRHRLQRSVDAQDMQHAVHIVILGNAHLGCRPGREDLGPVAARQAVSASLQWCMSCPRQRCHMPSALQLPGADLAQGAAPVSLHSCQYIHAKHGLALGRPLKKTLTQ